MAKEYRKSDIERIRKGGIPTPTPTPTLTGNTVWANFPNITLEDLLRATTPIPNIPYWSAPVPTSEELRALNWAKQRGAIAPIPLTVPTTKGAAPYPNPPPPREFITKYEYGLLLSNAPKLAKEFTLGANGLYTLANNASDLARQALLLINQSAQGVGGEAAVAGGHPIGHRQFMENYAEAGGGYEHAIPAGMFQTDILSHGENTKAPLYALGAYSGGGKGTPFSSARLRAIRNAKYGTPPPVAIPAWSKTYEVAGAPPWWQGLTPSEVDPLTSYLTTMNALIPYLSPEDSKYVASNLYQVDPANFAIYKDVPFSVPPAEMTTKIHEVFTSADRVQSLIDTFGRMTKSMGKTEDDLGAGYRWLKRIANVMGQFGGGKIGTDNYQTRMQHLNMLAALDPILAEGQSDELKPYLPMARYLYNPFFSAGQVTPLSKTEGGQYVFGKPNVSWF